MQGHDDKKNAIRFELIYGEWRTNRTIVVEVERDREKEKNTIGNDKH